MDPNRTYIEVEKIIVKPELQPCKRQSKALLDELRASIRERAQRLGDKEALFTPILITRTLGIIILVDGESRLTFVKEYGLKEIWAIETNVSEEEIFALRLMEKMKHGTLHPLDESDAYYSLWTSDPTGEVLIKDIAIQFGKSGAYVERRIKLKELSVEVKEAFEAGTISVDHAETLAIYPTKIQNKALTFLVRQYETGYGDKPHITAASVTELKQWLRWNALLDLGSASFPKNDETLNPDMGACTSCPQRTESLATLFDDLPKSMCTVAECFNTKRKAFAKREFDKAQAKYEVTPILVATEYGKRNRDVKAAYEWERCAEKDKGAVLVQMVDGKQEGKVVWGRLKTSETKSEGKASQPTKEEREKEERKALLEQKYHYALLLAVIAKAPRKLTDKTDLLVIHQQLYEAFSIDYDTITAILKLKGDASKWTVPELTQYIAAMFIAEIGQNDLGYLERLAKRYKVDAKKVRAEVKAEMKGEVTK
jgi:ParB/RepB/Spo0J family partition protein